MVEWYDASARFPTDQFSKDDSREFVPCVMQTVGWIWKETPAYIHIAGERDTLADEFRHASDIPKVNILSVTRMAKGQAVKKYVQVKKPGNRKSR